MPSNVAVAVDVTEPAPISEEPILVLDEPSPSADLQAGISEPFLAPDEPVLNPEEPFPSEEPLQPPRDLIGEGVASEPVLAPDDAEPDIPTESESARAPDMSDDIFSASEGALAGGELLLDEEQVASSSLDQILEQEVERIELAADEPVLETDEPALIADEPERFAEEPRLMADEPAWATDQPALIADEPALVASEPESLDGEPELLTDEPELVADNATFADVDFRSDASAPEPEVGPATTEEPILAAEAPDELTIEGPVTDSLNLLDELPPSPLDLVEVETAADEASPLEEVDSPSNETFALAGEELDETWDKTSLEPTALPDEPPLEAEKPEVVEEIPEPVVDDEEVKLAAILEDSAIATTAAADEDDILSWLDDVQSDSDASEEASSWSDTSSDASSSESGEDFSDEWLK